MIDAPNSRLLASVAPRRSQSLNVGDEMKRRILLSAIAIISLICTIAHSLWFSYTPLGTVVRGLRFAGVIMNENNSPLCGSYTNRWNITPEEIRNMETQLESFIQHHRVEVGERIAAELPTYRRYYFGLVAGEQQFIIIVSTHKNVKSFFTWHRSYSPLIGGGDLQWHIRYDPSTGEFSKFDTNCDM